jgi:SAM-dependent methyltransferase
MTTDSADSPACLLCGGTNSEFWATTRDVEYFTLDWDFRFHRCRECDVLFIDPLPKDHLAELYPPNYYSFSHALDSPVYRVKQWLDARLLKRVLRGLPGETLNALDVGGGTGWQLNLLRELDPRVRVTQVVDIDDGAEPEAIALGHRYFKGRIEDFETEDRFDIVLMLNLIEHVANPIEVLSRVQRILSPQGRVLIKTPNFDSLDARIFRHAHWSGYHCPRHWVIFNRDSFRSAALRAGLEVKQCDLTQGAPFWSGSTLNALSTRGWIRVDKEHPMLSHPFSTPLFALFAAFDFLRMPFMNTSQMFVLLGHAENTQETDDRTRNP